MKKIFVLMIAAAVILVCFFGGAPVGTGSDKRGCCSHHGGVCGCDTATGRQKCCDGTLSPTCRCGE